METRPIPPHWQALVDSNPSGHDVMWCGNYLVVINQSFVSIQGTEGHPWTFNAVTTTKLAKQASEDLMKLSKENRELLALKAVQEYLVFVGSVDENMRSVLKGFD